MKETKLIQISHVHTLLDGTRTSDWIISRSDPSLHWHEVKGEKTSTDAFGEGHTHEFRGDTISGPINIDEDDPMSNDETISDEDMDAQIDRAAAARAVLERADVASGHEDDDDDDDDEDDKNVHVIRETKIIARKIIEVKEEAVNGEPVGIVKGYIATWDLDRGNDRFIRGAFTESITELRVKRRQIRLKDHHGRTIGGFPIERVVEDDIGLFAEGHINLNVQQGREAFSLAKQGVLSDFSIGFSVTEFEMDQDIRNIVKAIVWEGSIVDEPMNTAAVITEVKTVVPFQDLPLADRSRAWDSSAAIARVREFTNSDDAPTAAYRRAFVWFDSAESTLFGAYKLPIADVINGRLTAIPRGIFAAAAALQGARGGVDIPEVDRPKVIRHVERYYAKMDLDSPFDESDKQYFVVDEVKKWTAREVEKYLKASGGMSKGAAKILASKFGKGKELTGEVKVIELPENWGSVLAELKGIRL